MFTFEKGDALIKGLSELIKKIFPKSTAYRIGRDEYVHMLILYLKEHYLSH